MPQLPGWLERQAVWQMRLRRAWVFLEIRGVWMHLRRMSKSIVFFLLTGSFVATAVSSCQLPGVSEITGITPTPITSSPTLTPTLFCPPIELDVAELKVNSTFVVVLFDEEIIKKFPLVYESGQTETEIYIFLSNVLPRVLGPGSEYSLFRLGYRDYKDAKMIRDASRIIFASL